MDRVGDRDLGSFLLSAFKNRYQEVLAKAHTTAFAAASKCSTLLTREETASEIPTILGHIFFVSIVKTRLHVFYITVNGHL